MKNIFDSLISDEVIDDSNESIRPTLSLEKKLASTSQQGINLAKKVPLSLEKNHSQADSREGKRTKSSEATNNATSANTKTKKSRVLKLFSLIFVAIVVISGIVGVYKKSSEEKQNQIDLVVNQPDVKQVAAFTQPRPEQVTTEPEATVTPSTPLKIENPASTEPQQILNNSQTPKEITPVKVEQPTVNQQTPDNSQIQKEREELAKYKAKDAIDEANKQIDIIWNATTQKIRDAILPEQDEWLKKRENDCGLKASSEEPNNGVLQETIKLRCMAVITGQRTEVLKQEIASLQRFDNNAQTSARAEPVSTNKPVENIQSTNAITTGHYQVKGALVEDTKTGLMWMRCTLGQNWDGSTCRGKPIQHNWEEMIKIVDGFNYENYDDWRVPTIDELKTLIYCRSGQPKTWNDTGKRCEGKSFPTIMDEVFFETEAGWHIVWSSSTDSKYNNLKFVLDFTDGHLDTKHKDNTTFQVRVVRGTTDNNQTRKEVVSPTVEQLIVENTNSANAEQHIQKMLRSAMINDQNSIQASKQYLENQPKPAKGDKKAAREVNDEALVFIKNKQYAQAVSLLAKASQLDPSDVEILNNYGFVLMMTNNLEQAESVLIKTLTMKPDRSLAWSNLGFAFALQGKKDMAVASYLNTYLFSKDPEKTLQFFKDILAQESNINVKNALTKAVDEILTDND